MREVLYISGLYAYLDALIQHHPKLIIDNCAAGGRRLDFEIMRRSVVLWRSDSCWGDAAYPRNVQAMTHGLSLWLPLHGLGAAAADGAALKSGMGACASFAINYRDPQSVSNLRRHLERYLPIRHLFTQNFYPLTPWTEDANAWLAFQFHDPVKQVGLVQAFRNPASNSQAVTLKLRDLDARQTYLVSVWSEADGPAQSQLLDTERSGEELMTVGVELQDAGQDGAVVVQYRPKGS